MQFYLAFDWISVESSSSYLPFAGWFVCSIAIVSYNNAICFFWLCVLMWMFVYGCGFGWFKFDYICLFSFHRKTLWVIAYTVYACTKTHRVYLGTHGCNKNERDKRRACTHIHAIHVGNTFAHWLGWITRFIQPMNRFSEIVVCVLLVSSPVTTLQRCQPNINEKQFRGIHTHGREGNLNRNFRAQGCSSSNELNTEFHI